MDDERVQFGFVLVALFNALIEENAQRVKPIAGYQSDDMHLALDGKRLYGIPPFSHFMGKFDDEGAYAGLNEFFIRVILYMQRDHPELSTERVGTLWLQHMGSLSDQKT